MVFSLNRLRKVVFELYLTATCRLQDYEKMSAILDELIRARREGVIAYEEMLAKYVELVKKSEEPENNTHYPESVRHSCAMRAFYDNCGEDEALAIALDKAVRESKQADFRHNEFKERRIKQALYKILKDKDEVERIYNIVVEQGEY